MKEKFHLFFPTIRYRNCNSQKIVPWIKKLLQKNELKLLFLNWLRKSGIVFLNVFWTFKAGMANVDVELVEFFNVSFIDLQRSTTLSPWRSTKWTTINEALNVQITLKKWSSQRWPSLFQSFLIWITKKIETCW